MATLSVQKLSLSGIDPTLVAASAGGDNFPNDGNVYLLVNNGGASPVTVTVDAVTQCNHGFDHDVAVTVPAGAKRQIGVFPQNRFNNSTGLVSVTYSDVTSVTVGAVSVK